MIGLILHGIIPNGLCMDNQLANTSEQKYTVVSSIDFYENRIYPNNCDFLSFESAKNKILSDDVTKKENASGEMIKLINKSYPPALVYAGMSALTAKKDLDAEYYFKMLSDLGHPVGQEQLGMLYKNAVNPEMKACWLPYVAQAALPRFLGQQYNNGEMNNTVYHHTSAIRTLADHYANVDTTRYDLRYHYTEIAALQEKKGGKWLEALMNMHISNNNFSNAYTFLKNVISNNAESADRKKIAYTHLKELAIVHEYGDAQFFLITKMLNTKNNESDITLSPEDLITIGSCIVQSADKEIIANFFKPGLLGALAHFDKNIRNSSAEQKQDLLTVRGLLAHKSFEYRLVKDDQLATVIDFLKQADQKKPQVLLGLSDIYRYTMQIKEACTTLIGFVEKNDITNAERQWYDKIIVNLFDAIVTEKKSTEAACFLKTIAHNKDNFFTQEDIRILVTIIGAKDYKKLHAYFNEQQDPELWFIVGRTLYEFEKNKLLAQKGNKQLPKKPTKNIKVTGIEYLQKSCAENNPKALLYCLINDIAEKNNGTSKDAAHSRMVLFNKALHIIEQENTYRSQELFLLEQAAESLEKDAFDNADIAYKLSVFYGKEHGDLAINEAKSKKYFTRARKLGNGHALWQEYKSKNEKWIPGEEVALLWDIIKKINGTDTGDLEIRSTITERLSYLATVVPSACYVLAHELLKDSGKKISEGNAEAVVNYINQAEAHISAMQCPSLATLNSIKKTGIIDQAVKLNNGTILFTLGKLYSSRFLKDQASLDDTFRAETWLSENIGIFGNESDRKLLMNIQQTLGAILFNKKRQGEAEKMWLKAIENNIASDNIYTPILLAYSYLKNGENDIEKIQRGIDLLVSKLDNIDDASIYLGNFLIDRPDLVEKVKFPTERIIERLSYLASCYNQEAGELLKKLEKEYTLLPIEEFKREIGYSEDTADAKIIHKLAVAHFFNENSEAAFTLFKQAQTLGNFLAEGYLGIMYLYSKDIPVVEKESRRQYALTSFISFFDYPILEESSIEVTALLNYSLHGLKEICGDTSDNNNIVINYIAQYNLINNLIKLYQYTLLKEYLDEAVPWFVNLQKCIDDKDLMSMIKADERGKKAIEMLNICFENDPSSAGCLYMELVRNKLAKKEAPIKEDIERYITIADDYLKKALHANNDPEVGQHLTLLALVKAEALSKYDNPNYKEADRLFEEVLNSMPSCGAAAIERAKLYFDNKIGMKKEVAVKKGLEILLKGYEAGCREILMALGNIYRHGTCFGCSISVAKDNKKAREYYEKALSESRLSPQSKRLEKEAAKALIPMYIEAGTIDEVFKGIKDKEKRLLNLGRICFDVQNYSEALKYFLSNDMPLKYRNKALVYIAKIYSINNNITLAEKTLAKIEFKDDDIVMNKKIINQIISFNLWELLNKVQEEKKAINNA